MFSFTRDRENYPGEQIVVEATKKLGAGSYGAVYLVREFRYKNGVFVEEILDHKRIVKEYFKQPNMTADDRAIDEYFGYKFATHLHSKSPVFVGGKAYMVMRLLPGKPLDNIISDLNNKSLNLTEYQYIQLGIALIRALKKQVHDKRLVHNDIKPGNIMVDLSNPNQPLVNIIDYGFTTRGSGLDVGFIKGTPLYMAPEVRVGDGSTELSDLHSLGVSLIELFSNENNRNAEVSKFKTTARSKFESIDILEKLMIKMTEPDSSHRATLDEAEISFQIIRLEAKANSLGLTQHQYHLVQDAHLLGNRIRAELQKKSTLMECVNVFIEKIRDDVPDEPLVIEELIETIGSPVLNGCKTKNELFNKIASIVEDYQQAQRQLMSSMNQTDQFVDTFGKSTSMGGAIKDAMENQAKKLDHKYDKHQERKGLSLDDYAEKAAKIKKSLQGILTPVMATLTDQCVKLDGELVNANANNRILLGIRTIETKLQLTVEEKNEEIGKLKEDLKLAISKYLQKTGSQENFKLSQRCASDRRLKDVDELLDITNNNKYQSTSDLVDAVNLRLQKVETGFFGRSLLRDEMKEAMNNFNSYAVAYRA